MDFFTTCHTIKSKTLCKSIDFYKIQRFLDYIVSILVKKSILFICHSLNRFPFSNLLSGFLLYLLYSFFSYLLQTLKFCKPNGCRGIRWHLKVSSWRYRNASHLWSVRKTGTLKLLCKETAVKCF